MSLSFSNTTPSYSVDVSASASEIADFLSQSNEEVLQDQIFAISSGLDELEREGDPIRVGSYNMYYKSGTSNYGVIESMSQSHDIFGLQEVSNGSPKTWMDHVSNPFDFGDSTESVGNNMGQIAGNSLDIHDVFVGTGQNGPHSGEFSPIFYSKERYEAVATESVQLHGENFANKGGPGRVANFVVLKDKNDGSTLLVVNTHWSNTSPEARDHSQNLIDQKVEDFKANYPIDGVIILGDFNESVPFNASEGSTTNMVGNEAYSSSGTGIDLVLTDGNITQNQVEVLDGGTSDHDITSVEMQINSISDDERKDSLENVNYGAVAYEGSNYEGQAWIFGFGTDPGPHASWNDEITSVMVGSDTTITFGTGIPYDEEGTSTLTTSDNVANVGEELDDRFSSFQLGGTFG